ncbi:MAG: glutamine synthetase adenylyltransferase [Anaerolineae bacterium]|nr:glutamine synthetase adenylyltransferase [Anaerolineae bacterium]
MAPLTFKGSEALLLDEPSGNDGVQTWLTPVGFTDLEAAERCLNRIAKSEPARQAIAPILPHLLSTLAEITNPDNVLTNFERFINNASNQLDLYRDFAANPRAIEILLTIFEGSQFLTEILLRNPHYFDRLTAHHQLTQPKALAQFLTDTRTRLSRTFDKADPQSIATLDSLRRYQRWELLRIGTSDLLGVFDLPTITLQLSHLADSLIEAALALAAQQLEIDATDFFVVGMGKLGGEELNYSSDIDLLFLTGSKATPYRQFGQRLIENLTRMTPEGFLYRVDMRLRPWGSTGELVSSVDGYLGYLHKHARLWEKQALLKARVVAGNKTIGEAFLQKIQPELFQTPAETVREEIRSLKARIETQLKQKGRQWGEVKLGAGSIRDIEFVTQYNQLAYGQKMPQVRGSNTLTALAALFSKNLLTADEYRVLTEGYTFLRTVEHHLQLMHYRQTHTLPDDHEALSHLARRLGFRGKEVGYRFVDQYEQHSTVIRLVFQQQLGDTESPDILPAPADIPETVKPAALLPHLAHMHASYLKTFSPQEIEHHTTLIGDLTDRQPVRVEATPLPDNFWRVTIVGFDYLGELSLICGLLFIHGFNIHGGSVFTYEPAPEPVIPAYQPAGRHGRYRTKSATLSPRQKIVDVFTVKATNGASAANWSRYERELAQFVRQLQTGNGADVQGQLAKRIAATLKTTTSDQTVLYPVDITIDNEASRNYTVLNIDAPDTLGFLYELANALALHGINIGRMSVETAGNRVRDALYVTDKLNEKITDPEKQLELRAATVLIKQFTHLLPRSPNPESALLNFREFVGNLFRRPNWPEDFASLEQPELLATMARLLGVSDFLWQDFLRMQHAILFPVLKNLAALQESKTKSDLRAELTILLSQTPPGPAHRQVLNAFKDREIFRIDMRQIQGHITEFGQFSAELSDLAEVVVEEAYRIAARDLRAHYGLPRLKNRHPCTMTICALGKCGGRELGFASDIELMFIYAGNGRTTGPRVITTAEFFDRLVSEVNNVIEAKREGIFELDLRLRPYGKAGSLGVSLDAFQRYFAPNGDAWPYERQALVKLRPIAGDVKLGQKIVNLRDDFIYNDDPFDIAAMRAMRERQIRHHVTAGTINAKLSPGGLVDIEYLVQGLQITYGRRYPSLRMTNTREALTALAAVGILPQSDYVHLSKALGFLQDVINALRMVRGNTKDLTVPPLDTEEFLFLARRMGYDDHHLEQFNADLTNYTARVQEINARILK